MKKMESFYYLLWFAYAKAYRKIWGDKLAALDSDAKGSSFPITWVGLTILSPFVLFFHTNANKKSLLLLSFILILAVSIYCFVMGKNKVKWKLYKNQYEEWVAQKKSRNKFLLLLLLIFPILSLILAVSILKYVQ
jgi:hypothetical protein